MKKFSYILLAVSLLLLTACLGDIVDSKEALLNKKLKSIISPEMMKIIRGEGMPVHYGTNPPNIEGTYLADDQTMKKSSFEDDDSPGTKYEDEVLTISEQDNEQFTATLKLETGSYSDTYSVVISGKEDKFTLYASTEILFDDNTGVNAVLLYSGRIQEGELYDLHSGLFITDKSYNGLGHIYYEADGVAKKLSGGESLLSTTIGANGGKLKSNTIEIDIPSGSFSSDTKVELKKQTSENVFGTNKASDYYTVTGLPADFSKPIIITVTTDNDAGDNLFMAMGEEAFVPSSNKTKLNYSLVESTLKEGKYVFELQPIKPNEDTKGQKMDLTFGLVKNFVQTGGSTKSSGAGKRFKVCYCRYHVHDYEAEQFEKYLNAAYDELVKMGFSFSKRTNWPVQVMLNNRMSDAEHKLGEFVPSKWGNNYAYMVFNFGAMPNEDLLKSTAGHELFHLVQALYDPRSAFFKSISAGSCYWLEEAASTWFEEIMVGKNYSSPTRKGHHMEPLKDIYKGANDNPQYYGYGMSAFVKYMVSQTDNMTLSKIFQKISEKAGDPVTAINGGSSKSISEMYPSFLDDYFNKRVYSDFEVPSLLTAEGVQTWNVASEKDTLKTFDNQFTGISAKIFKINLSNDSFDDNSMLIIKTDKNTFAQKYVYKIQSPGTVTYLDLGRGELYIPGLKQMRKDKATLLVVVAYSGYTDENIKTTFNIVKAASFKPIRAAVKLYIDGEAQGSVSQVQATTGGIYVPNYIKGTFNKNTFTASFDTESQTDETLKTRNMGNFTIIFNPTGDRIVSGAFKLERKRTWTWRDGTTSEDHYVATFKVRDIPINSIYREYDVFNAEYEEKGNKVGEKIYDVEYVSRYRDENNNVTTFTFDKITRLKIDIDLKEKE